MAAPQTVLLLTVRDRAQSEEAIRGLRDVLRRNGFGDTTRIVFGQALGDEAEQTRVLAPLLAAHTPRVVVALTTTLARSVQKIDAKVPIVFDGAADPQWSCLVDSLAKPGRNATGFTSRLPAEAKMLEALSDAFPALQRVVVLIDGNEPRRPSCAGAPIPEARRRPCRPGIELDPTDLEGLLPADEARRLAARRGLDLRFVQVCEEADFALVQRLADHAGTIGFVVPLHYLFHSAHASITAAITRARAPAIYARRYFLDDGGLMALTPQRDVAPRARAYELVARILAGKRPADLPVETPAGYELEINLRAVTTSVLRPSLTSLRRADRIMR